MKKFINSNFPTRMEILKLFWVILAGSNFLAFIGFSININSLINSYSTWEIFGILSYILTYSVAESIFVLITLIAISFILPRAWMREQFSLSGSLMYILGTLFIYPFIGFTSLLGLDKLYFPITHIDEKYLLIFFWTILNGLIILLVIRILDKENNRKKLNNFIERISILSIFYFILDSIGLLFIILRFLL